MRISVVMMDGVDPTGGPEGPHLHQNLRQTRAYAEFKLFSTLMRDNGSRDIHEVVAVLIPSGGMDSEVTCVVTVVRGDRRPVRVSVAGRHACEAIDRAADRVRLLVDAATQPIGELEREHVSNSR